MSEKIFDPNEPVLDKRRWERVELDNGVVYVKEMEASDLLFCQEHSTRAPGGPVHLAIDMAGLQIWQIVVSCYRGPEAGAARVFEVIHTERIKRFRREEWLRLREAIERVNGMTEQEADGLRDFTAVPPDASPGTPPPGVSRTSTDFPTNSPAPAPA